MARASVQITTALSAVVGIPVTVTLYPPTAIPLSICAAIGAVVVAWHLRLGGRASIRKSPKGTITFVLDPGRKAESSRRRI